MKSVIFYYSQSGQALEVAKKIGSTLVGDTEGGSVVYKEIVPEQHYPFPWSKDEFLNCMPECRQGMPPSGIQPIDLTDVEDADMVIVVGQSWFLSPSLPLQSFFQDEAIKKYLNGRKVVFVNACRNMWLMTLEKIKEYMKESNATLVGHIVLQDEAANLVSVVTIIRWLMYGKKEATKVLPAAGIDDKDVADAGRFGSIIAKACKQGELATLQDQLLEAGAIHYKPTVIFVERIGHRMFALWSKFILKKGKFGDPRRRTRQNLFFAYLLTALFVVSPFGILVFYLTYPFRNIKKVREERCRL